MTTLMGEKLSLLTMEVYFSYIPEWDWVANEWHSDCACLLVHVFSRGWCYYLYGTGYLAFFCIFFDSITSMSFRMVSSWNKCDWGSNSRNLKQERNESCVQSKCCLFNEAPVAISFFLAHDVPVSLFTCFFFLWCFHFFLRVDINDNKTNVTNF